MRLLHTSDWHLGRSLHRADLRTAQEDVLESLVQTVRDEKVDAVLVAGDVYDRAVPPVESVALLEDALARLRDAGARVVISSGNHDSATRLGFGSRLFDGVGLHVRTRPRDLAVPILLEDRHGTVGIYAVPYLEPDAVRDALPVADGHDGPARGHAEVLRRASAAIAADAARRGLARTVVTAHAWVTGGQASDSERDITVGGLADVPCALFRSFSYTALGHLHGRQVIEEAVRYSGSPLAYSFSEANHRKGSWLVDLDRDGLAGVEFVPAPVFRRLSVLSGTLAELVSSARFEPAVGDFVSVTLTDPVRPVEAMERLRARFPHVLTLSWEPVGVPVAAGTYAARVRDRDDLDVAATFVEHVRRSAATGEERALLREALEAVRRQTDAETVALDAAVAC